MLRVHVDLEASSFIIRPRGTRLTINRRLQTFAGTQTEKKAANEGTANEALLQRSGGGWRSLITKDLHLKQTHSGPRDRRGRHGNHRAALDTYNHMCI